MGQLSPGTGRGGAPELCPHALRWGALLESFVVGLAKAESGPGSLYCSSTMLL